MNGWCRKIVLALAIAVMPLQGIAASLPFLVCHGETDAHSPHEHGTQQDSHPHEAQHDEGTGPGGEPSFHPCCHLTASAVPGTASVPAMPDYAAVATAPLPLHDLFVPDRPQRPPLA